jgi:hypothetical protein
MNEEKDHPKTGDENEGVPEALAAAGIVLLMDKTVLYDYIVIAGEVEVVELTPEALSALNEEMAATEELLHVWSDPTSPGKER